MEERGNKRIRGLARDDRVARGRIDDFPPPLRRSIRGSGYLHRTLAAKRHNKRDNPDID